MTEILMKKKKNTVKREMMWNLHAVSYIHQSDENKTDCVSSASYIVFVYSATELHEELHD